MICPDCAEEIDTGPQACPHCGWRHEVSIPPRFGPRRRIWPILLAVLVPAAVIGAVALAAMLRTRTRDDALLSGSSSRPLAEARAGHVFTRLTRRGPSPQEFVDDPPPTGATRVTYRSGDLELAAWLQDDPGDGMRHPAVVFLHGGFAFGAQDWHDAAELSRHGFVVMVPMLRGENGNPGVFECFYGEVDDAIAAGRHLAALPFVDPENVFVAGHSVGGTLAILAAMLPSPFRAAASLSGAPEMDGWIRGQTDLLPFDHTDATELRLRNPTAFVRSLRVPLLLCTERQGHLPHTNGSRRFANLARIAGKTCELESVKGDHMTMVPGALERTAAFFLENMPE